jgi:cytochrome c peroxidase
VTVLRAALVLQFSLLPPTILGAETHRGLSRPEAQLQARALAELGRKMFFDPSLSASGAVSCASCHDPASAYGPPNALPVQRAGKDMSKWGRRAAPSLRYLQAIPQFTQHYFDPDGGDDSIDAGPTGGLTWDGRVDRGRDQARIPLLSPYEMANANPAAVVGRVRQAAYGAELDNLLRVRSNPGLTTAFNVILEAFEAFEQNPREFFPYSSKYDAWLAGRQDLTEPELRGMRLFTDSEKGNCARCHNATRSANGSPPAFTDYGFAALGVPRNYKIPGNANPDWYDLGLCGPERSDLSSYPEYCGRFRTPSLRNVAARKTFFHNGVFLSLKEAVEFYVRRDTSPENFYPRNADGTVLKFDDLPLDYRSNVDADPPFGKLAGTTPALTDEEIQDLVAFLETLTDGYGRK